MSSLQPTTNKTNPLTLAYGPSTYNAVTQGLAHRHKIEEAASADYYFTIGHYGDCRALCNQILEAAPSEAIQARAHIYLAMEGVGAEDAAVRLRQAERAVELWRVVIERRGASRFPVEKAREEMEDARLLVEVARVGVEQVGGA